MDDFLKGQIKIENHKGKITKELMELLKLADPNETLIRNYIVCANIFVAKVLDLIVGVVAVTSINGEFEIKNIAVDANYRNRGIAKKLIDSAKKFARDAGALEIKVGTGNSSLSQLALYQKCDFRLQSIESNYFENYPEKIFENGIRCIDLVILTARC